MNKTARYFLFFCMFFLLFLHHSYGQVVPKTNWSLLYVDSQELVGENGAATNAFDSNTGTLWHTKWFNGSDPLPHEIQIDLGATYNINGFRYLPRQDGSQNGRIRQYEFYVSTDGTNWGTAVATGTFANSITEKEVLFTQTTAQFIRLRALSEVNGNRWTSMAEISVLGSLASGNQAPNGVIDTPSGNLTINVGDSVNFTGTGTDPDNNTPLTYLWNFGDLAIANSTLEDPGLVQFNNTGVFTVTFTVTDALGLADPTPAARTITVQSTTGGPISKTGWSLLYVDSQELVGENGAATNSFDGNTGTFWHTKWFNGSDPLPHEIQIDLGATYDIYAFRYLPRQDGGQNGRIRQYEFYVSADGTNWGTAVATGTFANSATEKEVLFAQTTARFIRLRALSEVNGNQWTSMAEIGVLGSLASGNQVPDGIIDTPGDNLIIAVGDSVNFSGTGTDPDNNTPLTYLWNFGDPAITNSTLEDPGSIQFNNAGTFTVTFTVTDALGLADPTPATRTITVNTVENQAPDGVIDTPNGDITIDVGSLVDFTGTGTDPDNNTPLTYLWNFGDPAIANSTLEDPGSIQFNNAGTFTVTFTVTDNLGLADPTPATRMITVQSPPVVNQAPDGQIDTPGENLTINVGDSVNFSGTGTDPDNNIPLTYLWNFGDPAIASSTLEDPGSVQFNNTGTFTITFTVTDALSLADPTPATRTIIVQSTTGDPISKTGWSLLYVDSQELVGENGAATNSFDGSTGTFWHTKWFNGSDPLPHEIQIDLGATYDIYAFRYLPRQDGEQNGQIGQYGFYVSTDGTNWGTAVATGTFANSATEKEVLFAQTTARFIRLRALSEVNGNQWTSMAEISVLGGLASGNQAPDGIIDTPSGNLTINVGDSVNFTGTGTDLDNNTPLTYLWNFGDPAISDSTLEDPGSVQFNSTGVFTVTFTVTDTLGLSDPTPATRTITVQSATGGPISKTGWSLLYVDSQELVGENGAATNSFDGSTGTFWHTKWFSGSDPLPHEIQIDLGATYDIYAFRYLPRQDGEQNGRIGQYEFYVSTDGTNWGTAVATGTFANSATEKEVLFSQTTARFIRLRALSEVNGNQWTSMAEISVLGGLASGNQAPDGIIDTPGDNLIIAVGDSVNFSGTGTDPDNNIPLTYLWNFGDSTITNSTLEDPGSIQFNNAGTFTVTFTVTDALELADPTPATRTITVNTVENQAPDGVIDTPNGDITIDVGSLVDFTGTGTDPDNNTPFTYLWNFGDPAIASSTLEDPGSIQFNNTGTFTVTFIVTDNLGLADPTPATRMITVQSPPVENQAPDGIIDTPNGDITINVGSSVSFTGTGTDPDNNTPLTYLWNFGDPAISDSTLEDPGLVQFNNAGTFTVTFIVTDTFGLADPTPATRTISVQDNTGNVISQTGWSLLYVDSQELVGENGAGTNAFDGNTNTLWHTEYSGADPSHPHEIQIDLGNIYDILGFRYLPRQDNESTGRINLYEFYVSSDGVNWGNPVVTGVFADDSTEKEVLFTPITGQFVRLKALNEVHGFAWTAMAEINILGNLSSNQAPNGVINTPSWHTTINVGDSIEFSGTGTDPDNNTPLTYLWNFGDPAIADSTQEDPGSVQFNNPGTFVVTFTVTDAPGRTDPTPAVRVITVNDGSLVSGNVIPQTYWSLKYVDSEELVGEDGAAINAFDGNIYTFWHTKWLNVNTPPPHEIWIDLGAIYNINGFRYLPRQDGEMNGRISQYEFYASSDGVNWGNPVIGGTFINDGTEKEVLFNPKTARFIRLKAVTEVNGNPWTAIAEINVLHQCSDNSVQILQPSNYYLQSPGNLLVSTAACLDTGFGVKFSVDGGSANGGIDHLVYTSPFEANFSNLSLSEHIIETFVVDASGNTVSGDMTYDKVIQVGIGDYYVAVGNSITFGSGDDNPSDNESSDGRNTGGGYTPILNNLLTLAKNYPHTIVNEGVPGDKAINGLSRMPSLLEKYPYAKRYLVQYGTNDSGGLLPVPSGKGLNPGDSGYEGSFKDRMQQIINLINNAGKEVCLAKVLFTLSSTTRNSVIQDYNIVIDELRGDVANNISVIPPDFYAYFEAHQEEFFDSFHPNGTGYSSMADLWLDALNQ